MRIKEEKHILIGFDAHDRILIKRLVMEQVGSITLGQIVDDMIHVFDWYLGMMTMLSKISHTDYVTLDTTEISALVSILNTAYNNKAETEKEAIKNMADAIDLIR